MPTYPALDPDVFLTNWVSATRFMGYYDIYFGAIEMIVIAIGLR